ncbi:MAG: SGNH/GDSL hydrolase family protein [Clostridia bacterium]|nr:SGNH/GDSL hydrolase family protein [Clostridia bacterium]
MNGELRTESVGVLVIPAANAEFTKGIGVDPGNGLSETRLESGSGMIVSLAPGGRVLFRMPEGTEGRYDIYLRVSAILAQSSSQPFLFSLNGEEPWTAPVDCPVPADSPAHIEERIPGTDATDFCACTEAEIAQDTRLHPGDVLTIVAAFGAKAEALAWEAFPGIAALVLVPARPRAQIRKAGDPLAGRRILWLGSSVTYGAQAAGHYSMVDAIRDRHEGLICDKYAISGTTLVNTSADSYVARLRQVRATCPDLVVVQLSTNDAVQGKPLGRISEGKMLQEMDETTVAGAIEAILLCVQERFHCPVVFYTGTWFDSELYRQMVELLPEIRKKWGIGIIDLFHDPDMCRLIGGELYARYMHDPIHPYRAGYTEWWTPVMDRYLTDFMRQKSKN